MLHVSSRYGLRGILFEPRKKQTLKNKTPLQIVGGAKNLGCKSSLYCPLAATTLLRKLRFCTRLFGLPLVYIRHSRETKCVIYSILPFLINIDHSILLL
jgi:hypothetical protein